MAIPRKQYNARVSKRRLVHTDLLVLRVTPDGETPAFQSGQYTVLGLGAWENRDDGLHAPGDSDRLIRRAYSISCPIFDEAGRLTTAGKLDFLEFYVARVSRTSDDPPMLTPRLFALSEGDRLFLGLHTHGRYTLDRVHQDDDVLFFATGTGEAPHNAMIAELLHRGHAGIILCATCVRHRRDLAYLETHRELERRYDNYHYVPLTTREPENLDSSREGFVGKQYLQDIVADGTIDEALGHPIDPQRTQVFLCGNPAMIGLPHRHEDGVWTFPQPRGMAEILTDCGLHLDQPHHPGNIHFEKYW